MKSKSIPILIACCSSLIRCTHGPVEKALEDRSEYELVKPEEQDIDFEHTQTGAPLKKGKPVRRKAKTADVWVHPYEVSKREYFHGGWMTLVIDSDDSPSPLREAAAQPHWEAKPHE